MKTDARAAAAAVDGCSGAGWSDIVCYFCCDSDRRARTCVWPAITVLSDRCAAALVTVHHGQRTGHCGSAPAHSIISEGHGVRGAVRAWLVTAPFSQADAGGSVRFQQVVVEEGPN